MFSSLFFANNIYRLWGNPAHLEQVAKALRAKHSEDKLRILVAKSNAGNSTYDGIELGGERVCHEIEEELDMLEKRGQTIHKISLVGYSLGGLVARYAVGLLESKGIFDRITPVVCWFASDIWARLNITELSYFRESPSWSQNTFARLA